MAVVGWPDNTFMRQTQQCVLCGNERCANELTIGLRDAQGQQSFACDDHFRSPRQYILGWADFTINQQTVSEQLAQISLSRKTTDE